MIIIVFDYKDILYICIRRSLPQLIILKIMICRIGDAPSEWCFFSLGKFLLFDLFLYDCVNVRMLYKYVKKHRLIALVLNSDEKCNFSLLKLCEL